MIHEEYLPNALAIDVPYDLFWHLNPKKLECFKSAHAIKKRMKDEEMYLMGIYVTRAVGVAVEHCLCGDKAISMQRKIKRNNEINGGTVIVGGAAIFEYGNNARKLA